MSKDYNGVIKVSDSPRTKAKDEEINQQSIYISTKKRRFLKGIIFGFVICFVITMMAIIAILLSRKNTDTRDSPLKSSAGILNPIPESKKLGSEFDFNTKLGDLKRIHIKQKEKEEMIKDGEKITTFSYRITNYVIYILSEQNSDEENKYYYDKLFTGAISIESECFSSTNENCEPRQRVDFTNSFKKNVEEKRILEGNNTDLKDKPIPICLFNLTNNDVITSISCPESLPEIKKKYMILDLYYFKPPGLKRLTKENINSTITRKIEGNRKCIRETNGGICDIKNAQLSFCTTDINITTDLENNILSYDEEAIMNITLDVNNSYIKIKITNLTDESGKIEYLNPQIYEEKLNNIIQKLNPYLKYKELFSKDDFYEFYILSKNGSAALKKIQKRKLDSYVDKKIKNEISLFNYFSPENGINVDLLLFNNLGLNSAFMEAGLNLEIESNKYEILNSVLPSNKVNRVIKELYILSKAGNHLARELYQKINTILENMTEKINKEISKLIELVKYKDLSELFDSTLSLDEIKYLPFKIIHETTILKQELEEILKSIENGEMKQDIKILNQNIYDYLEESNKIINGLFHNLDELSILLSSSKSKLTEISTYYLNHTSTSYISIIEKAKIILANYYKNEYNLISQKVDIIIKEFEIKLSESVEKEMKSIDNLYEKILNKNFTINKANDEDMKTILNNLNFTKNYLNKIREKIIVNLKKEMNIKENGYFLSDYDINSKQESFSKIIEKAMKICKQLDNDEYIDTTFDEVMSNIIRNFTKIIKYMDRQKEKLFPLNEDVLRNSSFTLEIQNKIKNSIINAGVEILNKIRRENNLEEKQKVIKEFLDKNKENLDKKISELDSLFSVVKLERLAHYYEIAFNSSLEKTKNEINKNYLLSDEYFSTLSDDDKVKELLKTFHVDEQHLPLHLSNGNYLIKFIDDIASKSKTQGYLTKYNIFKENVEKSKLYVNEHIYSELKGEYQNFLLKIKEILQTFKKNKINDIYPDLNELSFLNDHSKIIDKFYKRLNAFISDDIFNNKYIAIMNNFKEIQNKVLNNIINDIESKHNKINEYPTSDDYNYDLCVSFYRKKIYSSVSGSVFYNDNSDYYCLPSNSISNNYLNLSDHSIETNPELSLFHSKFKEFYDSLSEKINCYLSIINEIKISLLNIEIEKINEENSLDYFSPIKDLVNSLLSKKYGEEIIKSSYNYYQSNIKNIIVPLLNNISFQWNQYFKDLYIDIRNNLDNFKSSINELSNMAELYLSIFNTNITQNYFDSIEKHQKSEFNYTINYYYNILLTQVKSIHQYILNYLPSNQIGFNNIINKRKNEVNDIFNKLIRNIEDSLNESLNSVHQLNILNVTETNFFGINDILKKNNKIIYNNLTSILRNINKIKNNKSNDEISLSEKFYLANSESGKQIEELYEQINKKEFIYLNLGKLSNLLSEYSIFNEDEFIKDLKDFLYNSNLEIQKELKIEKEKYISSLEEEITKTYTKEEISIEINKYYMAGVKSLELSQINGINKNINDILDKIKEEFTKEAKLLKETTSSYNKDFTKIHERLFHYKAHIIEELKTTLFGIINTFFKNINDKIYINYYASSLNKFISEAKKATSIFGEIKLLSDSYNVRELVDNIVNNLTKDYKDFVKNEIKANYDEIYLDIKKINENQNWENLIKEKIDESYNTILYPVLKEVAKYDIGIEGYIKYDLNDNIIKNINEIIDTKINNIKNIMDLTKGDNFEIDISKWKKMDSSLVYYKIYEICKALNIFILSEGDNEKEKIDNFLKEIMISNFKKHLDDFISSFGNRYLERIINYNENFKISSLYNNMQYTLFPTVKYYNSLHNSPKIKALTKDLKFKIYSLNDLDLTVQEKNKEVLDLLNKEIYEYIKDSQAFYVDRYIAFIINDVSIEYSFSRIIREEIIKNLDEIENNLSDYYLNLMNNLFKEKLISSYTNNINRKTSEIILRVNEERETLKSKLNDFFSLEPDIVLNEINNKINNTLYSINEYNSHFNTFKISEKLEDFLFNLGKMNIQPKFDEIIKVLNFEVKNIIVNKIDKNYLEYKNYYEIKEFIEEANLSKNEIKKKYINEINEAIDNYGKEEYPNNLEKEIFRLSETNRKRLNRLLTEEDIENEYKEKIADKALDETLSKILISSNNTKRFIDNYENFDVFDKIINENINKLNITYKKSLNIISNNDFTEEVNKELKLKLTALKAFSSNYFDSINKSFYDLKVYLKSSINDINNNIYKCANSTYITFSKKYEALSKVEDINFMTDNNLDKISDSIIIENQNRITTVNYTISQILKKFQFKFKLEYDEEGGIKKPKLILDIINLSRPKKIEFQFINSYRAPGDIIEKINIELNNTNFTMSLYYSTKSKNLYVTRFIDFESYEYSIELIQMQGDEEKCIFLDGLYFCYIEHTNKNPKLLSTQKGKIPRLAFIEEFVVHENYF